MVDIPAVTSRRPRIFTARLSERFTLKQLAIASLVL